MHFMQIHKRNRLVWTFESLKRVFFFLQFKTVYKCVLGGMGSERGQTVPKTAPAYSKNKYQYQDANKKKDFLISLISCVTKSTFSLVLSV